MSHIGITEQQGLQVWGRDSDAPTPLRGNRSLKDLLNSGLKRPTPRLPLDNQILDCDSYKPSHAMQLPPGTTHIYSYIESRGGAYDTTVFFGLQAYLKRVLSTPITTTDVDEAAEFWAAHGEPFDRAMWDHIVAQHSGSLPLEICALPEGMVVPVGTPLVTVVIVFIVLATLASLGILVYVLVPPRLHH